MWMSLRGGRNEGDDLPILIFISSYGGNEVWQMEITGMMYVELTQTTNK